MAGNFMAVSPFLSGQSMATDFTSAVFPVSQYDRFALQIHIYNATSLSGTLKMQVSINNVDYVDVSDATFSISGSDDFIISVTQFAYRFIRLKYTRSAGSALLNAEINTVNFAK